MTPELHIYLAAAMYLLPAPLTILFILYLRRRSRLKQASEEEVRKRAVQEKKIYLEKP